MKLRQLWDFFVYIYTLWLADCSKLSKNNGSLKNVATHCCSFQSNKKSTLKKVAIDLENGFREHLGTVIINHTIVRILWKLMLGKHLFFFIYTQPVFT